MSNRKPGAAATTGAAPKAETPTAAVLEDTANTSATVILPASSEDQSSSTGEEQATVTAGATSPPPEEKDVEGEKEKAVEQELQSSGDANSNVDRDQSSPATITEGVVVVAPPKPPTPTIVSDGLGSKSVRITRLSSPLLLLSSPTTTATATRNREASEDGEEPPAPPPPSQSSGSQRKSSAERSVVAPVIRGRKSIKDLKEAKEAIAKLEDGPVQVKEEAIDGSELESLPAAAAAVDEKDKDTKDKEKEKEKDKEKEKEKDKEQHPAPTCNRVTRKSHAQEQANNTRVTRNRRQSSTVPASSEQQPQPLPPARGRRPRKSQAVVPTPLEPATKRKRSEDDVESATKYSKIEVKAPPPDDEIDDAVDTAEEPPKAAAPIKQEVSERDTISPATTPSPAPPSAAPTPTSGGRRGRGRPQTKNAGGTACAASTSTRATRLSKAGSPGGLGLGVGITAAAEPLMAKRRRVGSTTRKTASASSLATSSHGGGDEDSKDSMASSMDDLLLAPADIKMEKLTPDFDDSLLLPVDPVVGLLKDTQTQAMENEGSTTSGGGANGHSSGHASCIEPLTVDADPADADKDKLKESPLEATELPESESESASGSVSASGEAGKAASLSPDMISVKFYKKFLANNLGIEKDPELGEIVQIASHSEVEVEAEAEAEAEAESEPDADAEVETEAKTEVELELQLKPESETEPEAEAEAGAEAEGKSALDDSLHSNSSLKAGTLRLEESTKERGHTDDVAVNGDDGHVVDEDDFDELDHEIMEQLARVKAIGVASDPDSTNADPEGFEGKKLPAVTDEEPSVPVPTDTAEEQQAEQAGRCVGEVLGKLTTNDADTEMEMDVDVEMEAEADAEPEDDSEQEKTQQELPLMADHEMDNDFPEENKENLSMTSTSPRRSSHEGLDIQLTLKDEEDEEKPLAAITATETKPNLDAGDDSAAPQLSCLKALKDHKDQSEEKNLLPATLEYTSNAEANGQHDMGLSGDEKERRDQEIHLHNLGLLTHQAAEQRRQDLQEAQTRQAQYQQQHPQPYPSGKRRSTAVAGTAAGTGAAAGSGLGGSATHVESSGTLKTVIKLHRSSNGGAGGSGGVPTGTVIHGSGSSGSGSSSSSMGSATRKASAASTGSGIGSGAHGVRRQSLKMTFQKGRARGHGSADRSADQHGVHAEDSYYTIQNENEGATKSNIPSGNSGRKTNNRFSSTNNNNNQNNSTIAKHLGALQHRSLLDSSQSEGHGGHGVVDHGFYQMVKKDEKEKILIPEKASSFKFHPGRLCEDQCYYCSGKFGLYDTPCHVGQIKSVERQQKILANEEKLTVDNCLCDACFRHVDRRANAAPYNKKRLSAPGHLETGGPGGSSVSGSRSAEGPELGPSTSAGSAQRSCAVKDCCETAGHQLRRKFIRKSVKKFQLSFEIPAGTSIVWLCEAHYNTIIQFTGCVLCKRRLGKNHMYNITTDTDRLEKALTEMGILVQLVMGTAVCKLCRYFANLLMKPPDSTKSQKAEFVKNYRKRLLKVRNLQDASNEVSEAEDEAVEHNAPSAASTSAAASTHEDAEMQPLVVDFDGPTDSNSSSSSITAAAGTATGTSKQISKLQAILQQNLPGETQASGSGSGSGAANGSNAANPDISTVLRGNPNISMRELFHGEEEMGLQFKVPFGCSSSQRTPEGWTRVQTFLQYDEPTRRLWEELQKPYGNQSSFLRHLILLEKYYRNGDLVLGAHASSNATVYTETVRQRLNSFDHGHSYAGSAAGKRPTAAASPGSLSQAVSATGTALATPIANSNQSADQAAQGDPLIPLVELNDDEDEDGGHEGQRSPKEDLNSHLERLTNVSVDKLTKQLSSNAVTIIARPKDKPVPPSTAASAATGSTGTGTGTSTATVTAKTATLASSPASISSASSVSSSPEGSEGTQKAAVLSPAQFKNAPPLVPTSSVNNRSILKTNLLGINKSVEIVPLSSSLAISTSLTAATLIANHATGTKTGPVAAVSYSAQEKPHKILDVANKLLSTQNESKSQQQQQQAGARLGGGLHSKLKPTTPMSLHQQQQHQQAASSATSTKTPTGHVVQQLNSPPELISLARRRTAGGGPAAAAMAPGGSSLIGTHLSRRLQLQKAGAAGTTGTVASAGRRGPAASPNVVILPETLTTQERHECKSWKPTLIPLEDQNHVTSKSQALYQTADGRRLPALVQVQSGGKPYLISIFDYNRMCILRREKLMRDQMLKTNAKPKSGQAQSQSQSGQNSGPPLGAAYSNMVKMAQQQQTARQQLQQLQQQQHQKQHSQQQQQMPTLQPGGGAGAGAGAGAGRLARLAPKPMPPLNIPQIASQGHAQMNLNHSLDGSSSTSNSGGSSSWLWNNFPDPKQYLLNGNGGGTGPTGKMPHLTPKPSTVTLSSSSSSSLKAGGPTYTLKQQQMQMQQQRLIDNAISKIPKSLIVIPQGGDSSGSSKE
ncbi:uncharacterized protein LOC117581105 isoform X2 [Drosophila guanche]|uniref:Uncharacterized protein n=1 Tax=Drosophila guanche TaxID=7266 RepID=A0A3B0JY21_DROGU|nr:uncharacterized protein LOC117581105 isoform X2 [Drosophila guanche]SPP78256.1 Hypothetical predicted protein [Drosophila guanche]